MRRRKNVTLTVFNIADFAPFFSLRRRFHLRLRHCSPSLASYRDQDIGRSRIDFALSLQLSHFAPHSLTITVREIWGFHICESGSFLAANHGGYFGKYFSGTFSSRKTPFPHVFHINRKCTKLANSHICNALHSRSLNRSRLGNCDCCVVVSRKHTRISDFIG